MGVRREHFGQLAPGAPGKHRLLRTQVPPPLGGPGLRGRSPRHATPDSSHRPPAARAWVRGAAASSSLGLAERARTKPRSLTSPTRPYTSPSPAWPPLITLAATKTSDSPQAANGAGLGGPGSPARRGAPRAYKTRSQRGPRGAARRRDPDWGRRPGTLPQPQAVSPDWTRPRVAAPPPAPGPGC